MKAGDLIGRVAADHDGPVRCVVLSGDNASLADEFAAVTGLTVYAASLLVDTHIERGTE